uniref:Sm domain-containing protein n=1 Tax=Syphacia muris TaxID=451379 RepID=A0A0N5ARU2_9BILA
MEGQYFFSKEFDANWLLSEDATENLESHDYDQCFESIDEFELNIIQTNVHLANDLQALDLAETKKYAKPASGKKREKRLKELCMQKALINEASAHSLSDGESTTSRQISNLSLFSTRQVLERCKKMIPKNDVLSKMKMASGPLAKLREWVRGRHRVRIVLRGRGSPNAIITAVIIAFDKHWNLVLRDGTELFLPPAKVAREITRAGLTVFDPKYKRITTWDKAKFPGHTGKSKKVYTRHLTCSMIRGENIVLIQQT